MKRATNQLYAYVILDAACAEVFHVHARDLAHAEEKALAEGVHISIDKLERAIAHAEPNAHLEEKE